MDDRLPWEAMAALTDYFSFPDFGMLTDKVVALTAESLEPGNILAETTRICNEINDMELEFPQEDEDETPPVRFIMHPSIVAAFAVTRTPAHAKDKDRYTQQMKQVVKEINLRKPGFKADQSNPPYH